jgi:hypothetical protein
MASAVDAPGDRFRTFRDAALTVVAVVLAFLAFDDITTDRASSFHVERSVLAGCGLWFASLALRFVQQGRRALGLSSLGIVVAAAVAQRRIGPGMTPDMAPEYLATVLALAWFLLVSGMLAVQATRSAARHAA